MADALVSIIIPVYNGAAYLREAIDSALAQSYSPIEVLVINDGSADNGQTARVAQTYGHRVRYFEKENGGVASALNMGVSNMRGEYFSWLSHDDRYRPDKILRQVQALERCGDPTRIAIGGYVNFTNEKGVVQKMDFSRLYGAERMEIPLFAVFHRAVHGCTLLIHKSHFERVGLFDESLRTTQDYDMWFRMMRGQRILYTGGLDVESRIHPEQGSIALGREHVEASNRLWIGLLERTTAEERSLLERDDYRFYSKLYWEMLCETNFDRVIQWLYEKQYQAIIDKTKASEKNLLYLIRLLSMKIKGLFQKGKSFSSVKLIYRIKKRMLPKIRSANMYYASIGREE